MMANGKELKHVESLCFLGEMFDSSARLPVFIAKRQLRTERM